jgi:hypothetical protein
MFFKQTAPRIIPLSAAQEAATLLGLQLDGLTPEAVKEAFRGAVRAAHPDAGGSTVTAADDLVLAATARSALLRWLDGLPEDSCPACRGAGWVRANSLTAKPCTRCAP